MAHDDTADPGPPPPQVASGPDGLLVEVVRLFPLLTPTGQLAVWLEACTSVGGGADPDGRPHLTPDLGLLTELCVIWRFVPAAVRPLLHRLAVVSATGDPGDGAAGPGPAR